MNVYIDGHSIYYSLHKRKEAKLNYRKLLEYCQNLSEIHEKHVYLKDGTTPNEEKFVQDLEELGYIVHKKVPHRTVQIVVDMKSNYDSIVVSNDPAFSIIDNLLTIGVTSGKIRIPRSWCLSNKNMTSV